MKNGDEYHININASTLRYRRRLLLELFILLFLVIFFIVTLAVPKWLIYLSLGSSFLVLALDVSFRFSAARTARSLSVKLVGDAIVCSSDKGVYRLPYKDISIKKVREKRGEIYSIYLRRNDGPTIKLEALDRMNDFYAALESKLSDQKQ